MGRHSWDTTKLQSIVIPRALKFEFPSLYWRSRSCCCLKRWTATEVRWKIPRTSSLCVGWRKQGAEFPKFRASPFHDHCQPHRHNVSHLRSSELILCPSQALWDSKSKRRFEFVDDCGVVSKNFGHAEKVMQKFGLTKRLQGSCVECGELSLSFSWNVGSSANSWAKRSLGWLRHDSCTINSLESLEMDSTDTWTTMSWIIPHEWTMSMVGTVTKNVLRRALAERLLLRFPAKKGLLKSFSK